LHETLSSHMVETLVGAPTTGLQDNGNPLWHKRVDNVTYNTLKENKGGFSTIFVWNFIAAEIHNGCASERASRIVSMAGLQPTIIML
jgi:hypothetical protein